MRWILLFLLLGKLTSFSQDLSLVNCLKGENDDILKTFEKTADHSYLLTIRSYSDSLDFPNPNLIDSIPFFASNWFFMMNAEGDTIWTKRIPYTEDAYYIRYYPTWLGVIPLPVFDYNYSIYTRLDNELALHYTFVDGLDSLMMHLYNGQGDSAAHNVILEFGSLNMDGSYKVPLFPIDTILRDSNVVVDMMKTIKLNDSIYQLVVQYSKLEIYIYEPSGMYYTSIYTINVHDRKVRKLLIPGYYTHPYIIDNKIYLWTDNYLNTGETASYLNKIGDDGNIAATAALNDSSRSPELFMIHALTNGKLIIGGWIGNSPDNYAIWFMVDTGTLSFNKHSLYNMSSAIDKGSRIYFPAGSQYAYPDSYDIRSYEHTDPYFINEEYAFTDSGITSESYLVHHDIETGDIISRRKIQISGSALDMRGDGFILYNDSMYNGADRYLYRNSLGMINWEGNTEWIRYMPDTMTVDSQMYIPAGGLIYYSPVNYYGRFIVGAKYIDTSNSNLYFEKLFYFFVSDSTGEITRITFPEYLSTFQFSSYTEPYLCFFNSPENDLSVISQESNKCLPDSSMTDIAIYLSRSTSTGLHQHPLPAKGFTLYPNPAATELKILVADNFDIRNATYSIYDISGKMISRNKMESTETTLEVSNFPTGLYLIHIQNDKYSETKKFQVIR